MTPEVHVPDNSKELKMEEATRALVDLIYRYGQYPATRPESPDDIDIFAHWHEKGVILETLLELQKAEARMTGELFDFARTLKSRSERDLVIAIERLKTEVAREEARFFEHTSERAWLGATTATLPTRSAEYRALAQNVRLLEQKQIEIEKEIDNRKLTR